jgi:hypothetical protein
MVVCLFVIYFNEAARIASNIMLQMEDDWIDWFFE